MTGLSDIDVEKNRKQYGTNTLINENNNTFFKLLLETLGDPIIKILLIALGIKTIFLFQNFDWYETIGIVIAIFIASFISTISEYGSEQAFKKLQEESSKIEAKVLRNSMIQNINIDDIVVNDLVILESGDKIPADGKIIEGEISVDESILTGETKEKNKYINDTLYRGTVVYTKRCIMKVTAVGLNTNYGKLASELTVESPESPLKIRLRELAQIISKIGYIGAILVSIAYLFSNIVLDNNFNFDLIIKTISTPHIIFGHILYAMTLSVTIIVVAVPEGLPMMITLVLSSNMKKMLKNNVLVRKMVGIETAGSLNILFTDKTGTLTKGQLEVVKFIDGEINEYKSINELSNNLKELVEDSIIYNTTSEYSNGQVIGGNSTDQALVHFIDNHIRKYKIIKSIPFDSKNKYMETTILKDRQITLLKGAPEIVLPKCRYYYNQYGKKRTIINLNKINETTKKYTKKGIRVLALAIKEVDYSFLGLVLIKDEIREEAFEGIELVNNAHINTVMITGDNKDTALSIANELNLPGKVVLTSEEMNNLSDQELKEIIPELKVVSRALPTDKSRLVKLARELNLVVGMTGDGVNDAPALKQADVGFAMGSGTEVAKEASDIVILDNNFLSITKAILFGRTIFKSIRKFIIFQLTVNFCAITLSIIGPFIGIETPITVIQMLWINMVMDTLAGLAFSFEPPLLEYMNELPKKKDESIVNKYMLNEVFISGLYSSIVCILFLKLPFIRMFFKNDSYFMTAFFGLFIFLSLMNAFNARTSRINIFANILKNKIFLFIILFVALTQILLIYYGGNVFRTTGLSLFELLLIIFISLTVVPVDWLRKYLFKKRHFQNSV